MKAKRCPFCNSHTLQIDMNAASYWIHCLDCGATGPHSLHKLSALAFWNGEEHRAGYTSLVTGAQPKSSNRNDLKEIE